MLSMLHIENIALVEEADITFDGGFNVLTGETGAGKTIIIDSIGAVLGERTSRDLIRTGEKTACVEALFRDVPELPWFEENGIETDGDGEVLIRREISSDGKNVCRVGGRLVTVAQLRSLGQQLLDIHGQHEGQALLDPERHLGYLDHFAGTGPLLEDFREKYAVYRALRDELDQLQMDEGERARRIDNLEFQVEELESAELCEGEEERLTERREILRNSEKLTEAVQRAYYALSGDDEYPGAVSLLSDAQSSLDKVGSVSQDLSKLAEDLMEVRVEAEDLSDRVRSMREDFDFSPQELDQIESRLDLIYRLKKKYGDSEAEMLDYLEEIRQELESLQNADVTLDQLESRIEGAKSEAVEAAGRLSERRREAAGELEERIQSELEQLDMPNVRFCIEFTPKGGQDGMDSSGADQVCFLMSANLGEDLKPISKVASGGELARIMLALKSVLAESDEVGSLIFDEVDSGVSGRAARKVGEKMADIARFKQVLCVTHLPQIAALADTHFWVEKGARDGRTYTSIERLDQEGRKRELARLMGGGTPTALQMASAGQLLEQASEYRESKGLVNFEF